MPGAEPIARQRRESAKTVRLRHQLLQWYALSKRDLPWRRNADPYSIWVSEIMLQQTRVAVVVNRYQTFLARFPTLVSLAEAPEQDVLALWSGLGYYRRARMLHKAAKFVVQQLDGLLPTKAEALRTLPGIGAYTAAAIASIAYGEVVAVVDGNVERVLCRLEGWAAGNRVGETALKRKIDELAAQLIHPAHPGDFNQALMELGATVCLPRNPMCLVCPVATDCETQGEHKTVPRPRMQSREVAHALSVQFIPVGRGAQTVTVKAFSNLDQDHVGNFLECVRSRKRPNGDVLIGHRSAQASHLGNISYMQKRRIDFDPVREEILPF